MLKASYL